ncbi:MAG: hypothetical protein AUI10_09210 [Actinobacteria bacterium 13_2_20CM_2_72_6]|nr:MAG: hypothetical protein AUI10_09210 [Actinobacteria bacterium 13_2_20CM_2_72_6]
MATDTPAPPVPPEEGRYVAVQEAPDFGALRKAYRGFVFPVTVAFLVWYGLYVIMSAYARGFMSHKLVGNINVALVFGLLQFLSTFLIAWAYTRFAGRRLDAIAARLRGEIEQTEGVQR